MNLSLTKSWPVIMTLLALTFGTVGVTAHAATFTVTNGSDSGAGSLRQAITDANAALGADTIIFSASRWITLDSMLPFITAAGGGLTIDGTGQTLTISGNNAVRVMQVDAGALLTLNNLTIANGNAPTFGGGGVINFGTLTITNSTFSGNSAISGGGVINDVSGTLAIINSTFSGNSAFSGGGVVNKGTVTITNSTFSGNSASGFGGGINNVSGTLAITNSTFSGNSASGNSASNGFGGGVYASGPLTVTNSTFSGNSATSGGGGIFNNSFATTNVTLRNTIFANSVGAGNCGGSGITNGGNNIDDGATCGWGAASGSMSSTNPLLGALANNGGPTQTLALLTNSPAIDGVTFSAPNGAPSTDQRGFARPQGVGYDIGAFEFSGMQAGTAFIVNTNADTNDGFCDIAGQGIGNKDCTLREAINAANAAAGADTIIFSVSGTITLASTLPTITAAGGALTINGTGQTQTISGNNAVNVMVVGGFASLTMNNLTIANGKGPYGSGIYNNGTLTITNSTFSGNNADNSGNGGGINNSGTATITNSTFSDNSANNGGFGAGVFNNSGSTLTITNSTFSGNSATGGYGGGIYNGGSTLTITNSTFSGNRATFGGGISNNSFVATNVTLRNTIVANSASGGNCYGAITNGGNNIDDGTTCGWGVVAGSMSSTNPLLGALANNGGPTRTIALLAGSPAIDGVTFGAPNGAPSTDQRGVARPQGVRYDIGAYEHSSFPLNAILFFLLD